MKKVGLAVKPIFCGRAVDAQWLAGLYVAHGDGLRRLVIGVLHDQNAADDVVQATFAKAADLGEEMEPAAMKAWLYRVVFNEAVTWKRRSGVAQKATRRLWRRPRRAGGEVPEDALVRSETVALVREVMRNGRVIRELVG